jgi:biopolymer transport protein ExbB
MGTSQKKAYSVKGIKSAGWVILACFVIAELVYNFVFGNSANFVGGDPNNRPLPGNFYGTIYKGGVIVPIIQTLLLTVITLAIERYIALNSAYGKGKLSKFVLNIKEALASNDMAKAKAICDKQKGSVANVVLSTLDKYKEMEANNELS